MKLKTAGNISWNGYFPVDPEGRVIREVVLITVRETITANSPISSRASSPDIEV